VGLWRHAKACNFYYTITLIINTISSFEMTLHFKYVGIFLKHSFGFEVGYNIDINWGRGQGGVVPPS
jgi:hypothetical protein